MPHRHLSIRFVDAVHDNLAPRRSKYLLDRLDVGSPLPRIPAKTVVLLRVNGMGKRIEESVR
jgi:hypothetical protein